MDEQSKTPASPEEQLPKFRGLYRHVNISVKALDRIIAVCVAVILLVVALELRDPGFTVTFNSRGGTDVPAQTNVMYSRPVTEPEPPTREGYTFRGWYADEACTHLWDFESAKVEQSMTLYAAWAPTA